MYITFGAFYLLVAKSIELNVKTLNKEVIFFNANTN